MDICSAGRNRKWYRVDYIILFQEKDAQLIVQFVNHESISNISYPPNNPPLLSFLFPKVRNIWPVRQPHQFLRSPVWIHAWT